MDNNTPQWDTIDPSTRDYNRAMARRRLRIIRRTGWIILAVVLASIGMVVGLSGTDNAEAATQQQINQYIRANHGIPPCKWEDGSGQPGMCVWHGNKFGNKKGDTVVLVPTKPGHDKRVVVLINR